MKTVIRWRWLIHHDGTGKPFTTRHHMTEAEALATDPLAMRVGRTREEIVVPDSEVEFQYTSGFQRNSDGSGG